MIERTSQGYAIKRTGTRNVPLAKKYRRGGRGGRTSTRRTSSSRTGTKIQILKSGKVRYGNTTYTGNTVVPGSGGLTANQIRQQSLREAKAINPNVKAGSYTTTYTPAEAQKLAKQFKISEKNRKIAKQQKKVQDAQRKKFIEQASDGRVVKPDTIYKANKTQPKRDAPKFLPYAPYKKAAPGAPTELTPAHKAQLDKLQAELRKRGLERQAEVKRMKQEAAKKAVGKKPQQLYVIPDGTTTLKKPRTTQNIRDELKGVTEKEKEESKRTFTPEESDKYMKGLRRPLDQQKADIEAQLDVLEKYQKEVAEIANLPMFRKLGKGLKDYAGEMNKIASKNPNKITERDRARYAELKAKYDKSLTMFNKLYAKYEERAGRLEEQTRDVRILTKASEDTAAREQFDFLREQEKTKTKGADQMPVLVKDPNKLLDFGTITYAPELEKKMQEDVKKASGVVWDKTKSTTKAGLDWWEETMVKPLAESERIKPVRNLLINPTTKDAGKKIKEAYEETVEKYPSIKDTPLGRAIKANKIVNELDPDTEVIIGWGRNKRKVKARELQGKGLYEFSKDVVLGEVEESFTGIARAGGAKDPEIIGKGVALGTEIAPYLIGGAFTTEYAVEAGEAVLGGHFGGTQSLGEFIVDKPIETAIIMGGAAIKEYKFLKTTGKTGKKIPKKFQQYVGDPNPKIKGQYKQWSIQSKNKISMTKADAVKYQRELSKTGLEKPVIKTTGKKGGQINLIKRTPTGDYVGKVTEVRRIGGRGFTQGKLKTFSGTVEYSKSKKLWKETINLGKGLKKVTVFDEAGKGYIEIVKNGKVVGKELFKGARVPYLKKIAEQTKELDEPARQLGTPQFTDVTLKDAGTVDDIFYKGSARKTGLYGKQGKEVLTTEVAKKQPLTIYSRSGNRVDDIILGSPEKFGVKIKTGTGIKAKRIGATREFVYGTPAEVTKQSTDDFLVRLKRVKKTGTGKFKIDYKTSKYNRYVFSDQSQQYVVTLGDDIYNQALKGAKDTLRSQARLDRMSLAEFEKLGIKLPAQAKTSVSLSDDVARSFSISDDIARQVPEGSKTIFQDISQNVAKGGGRGLRSEPFKVLPISLEPVKQTALNLPLNVAKTSTVPTLTSGTIQGISTLFGLSSDTSLSTTSDTTFSTLSTPRIDTNFGVEQLPKSKVKEDVDEREDTGGARGDTTITITQPVTPVDPIVPPTPRPQTPRPPKRPKRKGISLPYLDIGDKKKVYTPYYAEYIPAGENDYKRINKKPKTFVAALDTMAKTVDKLQSVVGRVTEGKPIVRKKRRAKSPLDDKKTGYFKRNKNKFRKFSVSSAGVKSPLPKNTFIEKKKYRKDSPLERRSTKKGWKNPLKF